MLFCLLKASGRGRARIRVVWEQVMQRMRGQRDGQTAGKRSMTELNFKRTGKNRR